MEKLSPREDEVPKATTSYEVNVGCLFFLSTRLLLLATWLG